MPEPMPRREPHRSVVLSRPDGRSVFVHADGPGRVPVLFLHPAAGSGDFDPDPAATAAHDVVVVGPDRPGYGRSTPVSGTWADVALAADDAAAAVQAVDAGPVPVVGWSTGGRVALALAARHPRLVSRLAVVATPAPDAEVAWISPETRAGLAPFRGVSPDAAHEALGAQLAEVLPADPRSDAALELVGGGPPDAAVLDLPGVASRLTRMLGTGLTQGSVGLAGDVGAIMLCPLGFDPSDVRADTLLVYGALDPITPAAHGRWWRQRLSSARLHVQPEVGHLAIVPAWSRILDFLTAWSP